jgi:hypothetical protein
VAAVILDAAAAGGGTADYSIQESADGSTGWAAVPVAEITGGAFTQVTTGGASVQIRYIDLTQRKAFVRAAATIATGPSVACFGLVAQKKYQS